MLVFLVYGKGKLTYWIYIALPRTHSTNWCRGTQSELKILEPRNLFFAYKNSQPCLAKIHSWFSPSFPFFILAVQTRETCGRRDCHFVVATVKQLKIIILLNLLKITQRSTSKSQSTSTLVCSMGFC